MKNRSQVVKKNPKVFGGVAVFLVCLFSCGFLPSFSEAFDNEPQGFRGALWWSELRSFSDIIPYARDGDWEFYRKNEETLTFGEALLDDLLYYFRGERFAGVLLSAYGRENRDLLLREARSRWGKGKALPPDGNVHDVFWYGRSLMTTLRYDHYSKESRLWLIPYFPRSHEGKVLRSLQKDFAQVILGTKPEMRSSPYRKGVHLFQSGKDRQLFGK